MEKITDWKNIQSKDSLLARFLSMFYVVPSAVASASLLRQPKLISRIILPIYRGQKNSGRARDNSSNEYDANGSAKPVSGDNQGESALPEDTEQVELDAESDPAHCSKLATGPGFGEINACCTYAKANCCCRCCSKRPQANCDCAFPHIVCSSISAKTEASNSQAMLRLVSSSSKTYVLGVLSCGYVLSGSGKLRGLSRRRA
ncbi:MAG: hypothetical protein K2X81_11995 [Candidatus Obscuribacterales bacterium]|nr:hypothetical protein [Candidatus Obscuribacterales bacterium]